MTPLPQPLLRLLLAALLLPLWACAPPAQQPDPFLQEWQDKAKTSQPYLPAKKAYESTVKAGDTPSPAKPAEKTEAATAAEADALAATLPNQPISVRFVDDDLATVLRTLGRLAGQNILLGPGVKGTVNLHIDNTPWNRVFMSIVNGYGLVATREDAILHVMSLDDLKRQVDRKTIAREEEQVSPLVSRIVAVEFSSPAEIAKSVSLILSKDGDGKVRGSVSVDAHSRSLIIQDTEANMDHLLRLVHDLDKPTPQILIEASIVEATKDTARKLGVQWGAATRTGVLGDPRVQLYPGGATTGNASTGLTAPANLGSNVNLTADSIGGIPAATIGLMINGSDLILDAQLSALQKNGKLNILSRPSIVTLDNAQAIIESGKEIPYQTRDPDGTYTINYKEATLKLTVTPHVISDTLIRLDIEAKKDEVDPETSVLGNPRIIKKLAKTQLIVPNGAVVVIAGLSKESYTDSNTGVPGVKDVPVLGRLFRTDSKTDSFEDLLIFITPKILSGEPTASAALPGPSPSPARRQP